MSSPSAPVVWIPPEAGVWVPADDPPAPEQRAPTGPAPVGDDPVPVRDAPALPAPAPYEPAPYEPLPYGPVPYQPVPRAVESLDPKKARKERKKLEKEQKKEQKRAKKQAKKQKGEQGGNQVGNQEVKPDGLAALKGTIQPKKEKKKSGPPEATKEMWALVREALAEWDVRVRGEMVVAAAKPERGAAIWRVPTSSGPVGFKLLHRAPRRSLFSVAAQEYLLKRGARVPPVIPTRSGQPYTILRNRMFVMTKWIDDLVMAPKDAEGAAALCYGLGEFHRLSRGLRPPEDAFFASRLHKWPDSFAKIRTKIGWLEELARWYPEMPASPTLIRVGALFRRQADAAIERLERSPYRQMGARGEPFWGLVHQDEGYKRAIELLGPLESRPNSS